ncbi:MAG: hypothetical protein PCFJNLEI_00760 [Verrucomicrobiae bacterium]|nr:hypothetical protein [Verrucomicrobiae bacterium]
MTIWKQSLILLAGVGLIACSQSTPPPPAIVLTDELRIQLAAADAVDGKTDHVVAKCVLCNLKMDGKPQFAVPAGDYTVRLCSTGCRASFLADPAKAMKISAPSMPH